MSQLFGQYGSILPQTYTQPMASKNPNAPPPLASAYGNFLGPGVPSLGADDPSRQRTTAYVLPRQIELMNGFFNQDFHGLTYVGFEPVNYSTASVKPPTQLVHSLREGSSGASALRQPSGTYGLPYTTMAPVTCAHTQGCSVTNAGSCRCTNETYTFL